MYLGRSLHSKQKKKKKKKKQLIGTFYRPPNSANAILSSIEDSIGLAFDSNIQNILMTGDFNLDILKDNSNRKRDLCQQFNFEQLINEPTHFTENPSSLIDLILTINRNNILISGVGEPFLEENIRYHCPVFCVLNFTNPWRHYTNARFTCLTEEITKHFQMSWRKLIGSHQNVIILIFMRKILLKE